VSGPRLARVAATVADPARARMLGFLLDGHRASAGELAAAASVGASTASAHLAKLLDAGLVAVEPRGRHRYFRLADEDVAHALEALAIVAERGSHARDWDRPERRALRAARRCYGHLAGTLGVALHDALARGGRLAPAADGRLVPTPAGRAWLADLGLDLAAAPVAACRCHGCLDWSERRDHLAGPLATRVLEHVLERGWLRQNPRERRALEVTPSGRAALLPRLAA
jgi:DNA-binding transcriptional ArsR family regulator